MGPPAFYTKVLNYMKVGQHYYSTLYKGQEPLELFMVFNPDPSQLSLKILIETSFCMTKCALPYVLFRDIYNQKFLSLLVNIC